jgi:predicted kinase
MKLILLYGPPASGKLTIAEKLSKLTGIPLFHNHLSRDLVEGLYGSNFKAHYALIDTIRYDVINYCAEQGHDLIFTYVYEGGEDDDIDIRRFIDIIEKHHGEVVFIELSATRDDLIARVDSDSRKIHGKLIDPVKMARITQDMNKFRIAYVTPIEINTSNIDPNAAVADIIERI